ncbi:MAG: NAD(P)/FAD-dependent oxidoreductase [Bacteroidota bacterium]|nr:NAD(P)/FAD-dependent oxidoreductase [Candidatus Kapabacteria bacterium]MDW8220446.1 NAD(P)/FAD-dependent oxidoreductase [Bacteroidota bacterium]
MHTCDVCIIGGGPSGYAAAMRAVDFGKRVILVEKERLGGAAIYNGALSSKTLWELSRDVRRLRVTERGYTVFDYRLDFPQIINVVNRAVQERHEQLAKQVDELAERICPERFRFIHGFGRLISPHDIEVTTPKGKELVRADYIVLATGSKPRRLPNVVIDEENIVTSDGIGNWKKFPDSLVILGAGVIGCEFASIFSNFGKTNVRLIDKADHILPFEDKDISDMVTENFIASGITIHRNASLESMSVDDDGRVNYTLRFKDGRIETHNVEKALISIGRVPAVEGLGAREIGLAMTDAGNFIVDADGRTNIPNIFAVGDLTADIMLVNVGELEGRHVIETIFGKNKKPLTYENISTIMFLIPEVSGVGMNEQRLTAQNIPYRVATFSYRYINRALAMRNVKGLYKIIVSDDDEMQLLGMRIVGEQSSSAIQAAALLIYMNKGIAELAELIHPHPSIVEGAQECVRMLLGKSVIKPQVFPGDLRCVRVRDGKATEINYFVDGSGIRA